MGTVGKFDEDDADILYYRYNYFAKVFGLRFFFIAEFEFIKFRYFFY